MDEQQVHPDGTAPGLISAISGVAALVAGASFFWCVGLQRQIHEEEQRLSEADRKNADLLQRLNASNDRLRVTSETLGHTVGMTQRQIEERAQGILAEQKATTDRVARQQAETVKQIGVVSQEVATVRTDMRSVSTEVRNVSGDMRNVNTEVAAAKRDLETTKTRLNRVASESGAMSARLAKAHEDLEVLRRRGERSYYEFTLQKGSAPVVLAGVKLRLKGVDELRSRYVVVLSADDRNILKNRNLNEPVQFYAGRDHILYELVVNSITKDRVLGYLSVPKASTPAPAIP